MKQAHPPKSARRRILHRIPVHLRIALWIAILFGTAVTMVGRGIGSDLLIPTERVSMALGYSAMLPVALGFLCYAITAALAFVTRRNRPGRKPLSHIAGNDLFLLLIFVVISYFHFNLKMWLPLINPALFDAEFMVTDEYLSGLVEATKQISSLVHENFPSRFRYYQNFFVLSFIISFCSLAARRDEYYPRFVIGIFLVLSLGCFSYLIMPAVGPFIFETGTNALTTTNQLGMYENYQLVQAHGVDWVNEFGGLYFTGSLAAMPSLHVAHSTVMTYYMIKSRASLYPVFLVFWLWIFIESIALRWHYVVDDVAGFVLAVLVIRLVTVLFAKFERAPETPARPELEGSGLGPSGGGS